MTKPFDQVLYDVHGNYRARRVEYTPPDQWVDDSLTWPLIQFHLIRIVPTFALAATSFFLAILLWIASAIADLAGGIYASGPSSAAPSPFGGLAILFVVLALVLFVAAIVTLFLPYREPLAEYSLLVEGRAAAASSSYWWIWSAARQRQSPYQVQPAKLSGQHFLTIGHGRDQVVIVVREVGADLFVGWNMWRSRSSIVLVGHYFRDLFANGGPGASFRSSLRNSHTRALRETGHSLLREGVQAAIYGITPGNDTLQRDLAGIPDVEQVLGSAVPTSNAFGAAQGQPAGSPQQTGNYSPPGYAPPPASAPHSGQPGTTDPSSGAGYGQTWQGNQPQNPS
jgi:hypothetical protein